MLNIFLDPAAVGIYSISVALAEKIWIISQSAGIVLFPKISSEIDSKKIKNFTPIVCRNILAFSVISSIALLFLGPKIIILLYSSDYFESIHSFKILLLGIIAISGSRILSNDLSGRGRLIENMYINIISISLNIILNIILIPKYKVEGAAWATSVSYSITFLMKLWVYSRISGNSLKNILFIKKSDIIIYKNILCRIIGYRKNYVKQ
jgi:O-antigen/teichoic acid export membrane protein